MNERSAMKVNTDGVLLGAVMTVTPEDRVLLDIGTGTGTIALMAAQRLTECRCSYVNESGVLHGSSSADDEGTRVQIHAIDIDEPSSTEAAANFLNSPWGDILSVHHVSLDAFAEQSADIFDLIFSNPPYFDNALQAPEERRNAARHTSTGLSYREILDFASRRLSEIGRVAMVLPADTEHDLFRHARMVGLYPYRTTRIRTVPRKSPTRIIAEFSRHRTAVPDDKVLTIQNEGQYTQEYLSLTKDFYLFA